ncbi:hypothetical protein EV424DRAFT_1647004 [Suillus variegatus]|nr:hypothetical protein EV424DRAFT_1647004 [Suillus variegatus]
MAATHKLLTNDDEVSVADSFASVTEQSIWMFHVFMRVALSPHCFFSMIIMLVTSELVITWTTQQYFSG